MIGSRTSRLALARGWRTILVSIGVHTSYPSFASVSASFMVERPAVRRMHHESSIILSLLACLHCCFSKTWADIVFAAVSMVAHRCSSPFEVAVQRHKFGFGHRPRSAAPVAQRADSSRSRAGDHRHLGLVAGALSAAVEIVLNLAK